MKRADSPIKGQEKMLPQIGKKKQPKKHIFHCHSLQAFI